MTYSIHGKQFIAINTDHMRTSNRVAGRYNCDSNDQSDNL